MVNISKLQITALSNWQNFQSLCCELWKKLWNDTYAQKNGRSGQKQKSVNIWGNPNQKDLYQGIQCKKIDINSVISENDVREEVENAKEFYPQLELLIIDNTGKKDTHIEKLSREITEENKKQDLFAVKVMSWDDIKELSNPYPDIIVRN